MADNRITTAIKEATFDSIITEFDKELASGPNDDKKGFTSDLQDGANSKVFDSPPPPKKKPEDQTAGTAETKVPEQKDQGGAAPATPKAEETPATGSSKGTEVKDIGSVLDRVPGEDDDDETNNDGVPFRSALESLIKDEVLFPFDEDKKLSEYGTDDIKELIKANIEHRKTESLENEMAEFFESLPDEIKYAAEYVANGGTDLKSLFKALAATEEIKTLDTGNLKDRESIIREYYRAIEWGSEDEIAEEVNRIKELGDSELEKQAAKFKPKLEKMYDDITKQQLARQERARQLQEQEMTTYLENAQEAIKAGKIGDLALDKKTQVSLWAGLTQPTHQTRRGISTNELGHLLEKYQYTEPDFEKIYKVLWLLRDEKGFEEALAKKLKNEVVGQTVRVLKTEQGKRAGNATSETRETDTDATKPAKKVIQRKPINFMDGLKPKS